MDPMIENALHELLIGEKNNVNFYCHAIVKVRNSRTKQLFEQLAGEGIGYINVYAVAYKGSESITGHHDLLKLPQEHNYLPYRAFLNEIDACSCEKQALEISLREVQSSISLYTELVNGFRNQSLCELYKRALRKSYKHYEMIHREYIRIIGQEAESLA